MVSNNMIPQYNLHFPRTMRLHLDLNATPAVDSSEDFVADFRRSDSSLEVQSASTHGEVVAVALIGERSRIASGLSPSRGCRCLLRYELSCNEKLCYPAS
jgi:hypothetical protein